MRVGMRLVGWSVSVLTAALISCDRAPAAPEYSTGFYNDTGAEITDTRADWKAGGIAHHDEAGILSVDAEKASHEQPRPIPDKATVTWKAADGKRHSKAVEVAKLITDPPKFAGTIFFRFTVDGNVVVVPLTYADPRDIRQAAHAQSARGSAIR